MLLYDFNALTDSDKAAYVWNNGSLVDHRYVADSSVLLYQLYSFYVEVWYNSESRVEFIKSFSNTDELQPYLENIDISDSGV